MEVQKSKFLFNAKQPRQTHTFQFLLIICFSFVKSNAPAQVYQWAKNVGNIANGIEIVVDLNKNSYVIGEFAGTADFDPGPGIATLTAIGSDLDIFIAKYDSVGNYLWAHRLGNSGEDKGYSIAVDVAGNCCITGCFILTVDFDPGPGTATLVAPLSHDIFLAKYDGAGNYLWARSLGNNYFDCGSKVTLDVSGNVYLTGSFTDTVDFDPGMGIANLASAGGDDAYFAKYSSSGNYIWAHKIGDIHNESGHSIAIDGIGNIYLAGAFQGTVDFDPGPGVTTLTCLSSVYNTFFAKYDAAGVLQWAKSISSSTTVATGGLEVDASANIYMVGYIEGSADFDPGPGVITLVSAGAADIFVAKFNGAGHYLWAHVIGDIGDDVGYGLSLDVNNNLYITGGFYGTVDFDPGGGIDLLSGSTSFMDIFFASFDNTGNYRWAKSVVTGLLSGGNSIEVDGAANIYITGLFTAGADFDPGPGTASLSTTGADMFIAKYKPGCDVGINYSTNPVCSGEHVILSTFATGSLNWSTGASSSSISVTPSINAVYSISASVPAGTTVCTATAVVTVSVHAAPLLSISVSPSFVCQGMNATLIASGANTYTWSGTGNTISSLIITPTATTIYSVVGTNSLNCSATQTVVVTFHSCSGIQESVEVEKCFIYPNPSEGNIRFSCRSDRSVQLRILNSLGQLVQIISISENENSVELTLPQEFTIALPPQVRIHSI